MSCFIDQIIRLFGDQNISCIVLNDPHNEMHGARLFNESTEMDPGILYVGLSERMKHTDFGNRSVSILCIGRLDNKREFKRDKRLNLLSLDTGLGLEDVFNRILVLFQRNSASNAKTADNFYKALFFGKGVQTILNIGWEMLSNPVFLLTERGELVAKAADMQVPDAVCEELHKTGAISGKTMGHLFDEAGMEQLRTLSRPMLFKKEFLMYDRILGVIRFSPDEKGVIVVLEINRPFQQSDYDIIQMLCSAVEQEISQFSSREDVNNIKKETVITDLLDGTIEGPEHLQVRLSRMRWKVPSPYRLMFVEMTVASNAYLTFYKTLLQQAFREADVCIYKDALVVLLPVEGSRGEKDARRQKLEDLLGETGLRCAVSSKVDSLLEMRKAYSQALNLQLFSRRMEPGRLILDGDSYLLHSMLRDLGKHNELTEYCHHILRSIREYDSNNNGEYEQTLYVYIKNGKNLVKTFEDLHIHRNTLSYRLNRLEDLFGVDFDDGYMLAQLLISYEIFRM